MTNTKQLWVKFQGVSMSPLLNPGDELLLQLKDISSAPLQTGQIVLYRDHKEWIAHRIIGRDQQFLEIKGDAAIGREVVNSDRIIGVIVGARDCYGQVQLWSNGLHPMARAMALLSAEVYMDGPRLMRWPFYACMRLLRSFARGHLRS